MGKISRIQLRGISRTPSDRLTEDGGCAESLNVQLDNTELAPSFIPEDVTKRLGLPDDLQAEKVFVHKTANYENYIVVQEGRVVAYTPQIEDEEPLVVLELVNGERVNDINSIGNTLIISTNANLYYILFKERRYALLGNKVPFPYITFNPQYGEEDQIVVFSLADNTTPGYWPYVVIPEESEWNGPYDREENEERLPYLTLINKYWDELNKKRQEYYAENKLTSLAVVRYSVDIMGEQLVSMPIVLHPSKAKHLLVSSVTRRVGYFEVEGDGENSGYTQGFDNWEGRIEAKTQWTPYDISVKINNLANIEDWKDVIQNISIYVQIFDASPANKTASRIENRKATLTETKEDVSSGESTLYEGESTAELHLGDKTDTERYLDDFLFATANTRLVKTIKLLSEDTSGLSKDFMELQDGFVLNLEPFLNNSSGGGNLNVQEMLSGGDMQHYAKTADRVSSYNNSLILVQPSQIIEYDYGRLNAYDITKNTDESQQVDGWSRYEVTYLLKGATEDKVVKAGPFLYWSRIDGGDKEEIYPFQIFPDSRAYKMIVRREGGQDTLEDLQIVRYGVFDMVPHPYLDCAYYYGGFDRPLKDLCTLTSVDKYTINAIDDLENKVMVSDIDMPFIFPKEHRYTFQSKVIGIAVATHALSQGQFGQFPLYVFTEDGIWAMETAADGSFVTSKPLSRDVCVNAKSITSIDNAVVFVSDKGVMLLQGSQVTNISPFMNGKHYVVENTAQAIIEGQDFFCDLLPAISDKTHFLAFVKEASVAYDYAGKRLVFIKDDEAYQYVYKLDTQTWHKVAYGINMQAVINSYPECLVQGKGGVPVRKTMCHVVTNTNKDGREYLVNYIKEYFFIELTEEQINAFLDGEYDIDVTHCEDSMKEQFFIDMSERALDIAFEERIETVECTRIYDLSTLLDAQESMTPTRGIIATRPFDLGEPDILKTITDIRVRGQFPKGAVKFILLGSNDGVNFYTLSTLRGKSWKLFRMILLADLAPTDRISWVDVQYETKFTNRLR